MSQSYAYATSASYREPLCQPETSSSWVTEITSVGVTRPSSLVRAHAPHQPPPPALPCGYSSRSCAGCCESLRGGWWFPTLSLQSIHRRLDLYPAMTVRCIYPFLTQTATASPKRSGVRLMKNPGNAISTGQPFRGCSHSLMFRLLCSLDPPIAPTAEVLPLGGRAVYTTQCHQGYPSWLWHHYASVYGQLTRRDFHPQDCSLIDRYRPQGTIWVKFNLGTPPNPTVVCCPKAEDGEP